MDSLDKEVFTEYQQRVKDEHERISHRLSKLEQTVEQISELTSSVKELAVEMKNMAVTLSDQNVRLKIIEERDGEKWRKLLTQVMVCIVGGVIGYVFCKLGMG